MSEGPPPTGSGKVERHMQVASVSGTRRSPSAQTVPDQASFGTPSAQEAEALEVTMWGGHIELILPASTQVHESVLEIIRGALGGWQPGAYDEENRIYASIALPDGGESYRELTHRAANHLLMLLPDTRLGLISVEHVDDPIPGEVDLPALRLRPALALVTQEEIRA